jgi:Lipopolysaccharide export system permease LptF/LptG
MSRPGTRLRALAAHVCSARTMELFIDPVIGDLQTEYAAAIRDGQTWRRRRTLIAGYVAFAKVLLLCGLDRATHAWDDWSTDDRRSLQRILRRTSVVTLFFASLVELPELLRLRDFVEINPDSRLGLLVAYLIPSALAVSIPVGVAIGSALSLCGRAFSRRLFGAVVLVALGLSVTSLLNMAWVVPAANQAFREEVFGGPGPLRKGHRELTLSELGRAPGRDASFEYHQRWAVACAPLTFALFGVVVARRLRRASAAVLAGVGLVIVYDVVMTFGGSFAHQGVVPPTAAAWTPPLLLLATVILLARVGTAASVTRTRA